LDNLRHGGSRKYKRKTQKYIKKINASYSY
jgi:hypothetical protein